MTKPFTVKVKPDSIDVVRQAERELEHEIFRAAVEVEKHKIRKDLKLPKTQSLHDRYEQIIDRWQFAWMNDSEKNYHTRALGVDANMKHDLVNRLVEAARSPDANK